MELDLSSLDEPQETAHEFEIDLHCVVVANHGFTLEAIERSEDEELTKIEKGFALEDREVVDSIMRHERNFYDDLRQAARRLALVALVTRLQHWIERFVRQVTPRVQHSSLAKQLSALNSTLGIGPVSVLFFEDLVTVRDSIIHNDSRAEWEYQGRLRKIADEYRNPSGDVELTEEQLKDAIQKATQQVKWYEEKIHTATAKP